MFYPVSELIKEFEAILIQDLNFNVVTIVGEGEPTLYLGLGQLIQEIQKRTKNPVAIITNGALLYDEAVCSDLSHVDIVLPSMDAYDEESYKKIARPHGSLHFEEVHSGLKTFSSSYKGQLWLEIMLMKGINDDERTLERYRCLLEEIRYDKLYLNTPVRPPAEDWVQPLDHEGMKHAAQILGGISIDFLESEVFHSENPDHYEAILDIIKRHPMNQHEIEGFLNSRGCVDTSRIFENLFHDPKVHSTHYKGYFSFRQQI